MKRRTLIHGGISAALLSRLTWADDAKLDVAYINASIWTGLADGQRPTAVGLTGNRITALGKEAVRAGLGPRTEVVDLDGAFVMPALWITRNGWTG